MSNNNRNEVFYKQGFNEGIIDCIHSDLQMELYTIEQRAEHTWMRMGYRTHLKYFIKGYKDGAKTKEK